MNNNDGIIISKQIVFLIIMIFKTKVIAKGSRVESEAVELRKFLVFFHWGVNWKFYFSLIYNNIRDRMCINKFIFD